MLLGNYNVFNGGPGREMGGTTNVVSWMKGGSIHNFFFGDAAILGQTEKAGFPPGYGVGGSWALPPKAGGLSAHRLGKVLLQNSGVLVGGRPGAGSASISVSGTGNGGLIVSGTGSASIVLTTTGAILSVASGTGSASVSLTSTAAIRARAQLAGSVSVTLSPAAALRAIGKLSGISSNQTEFSADALARAVWDALATDYSASGSMAEVVKDAASAGNPWGALLVDNQDAGSFGERIQKLLTLAHFLGLK